MPERRRARRRSARIVLGIEAGERTDRAGLTNDVSPCGLSFRSPSKFNVGEVLKLRFRDPAEKNRSVEVYGTVVRVDRNNDHFLFRHNAAVQFQGEVVALEV